ncbi:MAG TPA: hypothetical protein V6C81_21155 [Planktothrix sp.]|jgi:hypothetical protein
MDNLFLLQGTPLALAAYFMRGCLTSIAIETPVLCVGLSRRHTMLQRIFAGIWLTTCSYPIVMLFLPHLINPGNRGLYLGVAETFAPISECAIFWLMFGSRAQFGKRSMYRDFAVIVLANLLSFGFGQLFGHYMEW